MNIYRQGDVLLLPIETKEAELEPAAKDPRGLVLAEGETSGHYHAVFGKNARLMRYRNDTWRIVLIANDETDIRVVGGGVGGGGRMGEPQELTALNAVASTYGLRGEQYVLEVET